MLRALRRQPCLVGTAEVLVDAVRHVAIVLVALMVLAQAIRLVL